MVTATAEVMPTRAAPWWSISGHPPGMTIVILTGLWEIFALAGMRTILVYYLVKQVHFADALAIQVYSLSTAAAFMMSLAGALLADHYLGARRAIAIGAVLMAVGHISLLSPQLLYPALGLIVLGNGLLKPSLVAMIGRLYSIEDPRRDRAFVLYKAGCNAGGIFSPIVCGVLGETFGWTWALAACGVGMLISTATFVGGRKYLPATDVPPPKASNALADSEVATTRARVFYYPLALALFSCMLFAAAHGQQGATIALWTDRDVDRALSFGDWSYVFPAAWFQSLNPIVIVLATPIVNLLWSSVAARQTSAGQLRKMRFGAMLLTVSFCVFALASATRGSGAISALWPCAALILLALGELYFDAIGQAFVIGHASRKSVTTFVSIWFLVQAFGFTIAGWIAEAWGVIAPAPFFWLIAALAAASCAVVALASYLAREIDPT
jgi:proton-dependent oligopeptide transporter, POT family